MGEDRQAESKGWSAALRAAVQERYATEHEKRPQTTPEGMQTALLAFLRNRTGTEVSPETYQTWLDGTSTELPGDPVHNALLEFLTRGAEINVLEDAYQNASASWRRRVAHTERPPREGKTRTLPDRPQQEKPGPDRLLNAKNFVEFMTCFCNHSPYGIPADTARAFGVDPHALKGWVSGTHLPGYKTLDSLRRKNSFKDDPGADGVYERHDKCEKLVVADRRILMEQALEKNASERFGAHLSHMPACFAFQELRDFLRSRPADAAAEQAPDAGPEPAACLIISHGIYLHFLRHALGIKPIEIQNAIKVTPQNITNLESDHNAPLQSPGDRGKLQPAAENTADRGKLQKYLERELEERVSHRPGEIAPRNIAIAEELLRLVKSEEGCAKVKNLGFSRPPFHAKTSRAGSPPAGGDAGPIGMR